MSISKEPGEDEPKEGAEEPRGDDFDFYLQFTKPLVLDLPTAEDRAIASAWVQKLEAEPQSEEEKQLRLDYLKLLLFVLQRGRLSGIFKKQPPQGALQPFLQGFTVTDMGKLMIDQDESQACGGGDTRAIPYTIDISNDLREFVAAQEIPKFGVQMYYAWSSDDPLFKWSLFDEEKFPQFVLDKIKQLREIKSNDKTNIKSGSCKKKLCDLSVVEKYSKKKVKSPQEIERAQGRSYHTYVGLIGQMGGLKDKCNDDQDKCPRQDQGRMKCQKKSLAKRYPANYIAEEEYESYATGGGSFDPNQNKSCNRPPQYQSVNCELQLQLVQQPFDDQTGAACGPRQDVQQCPQQWSDQAPRSGRRLNFQGQQFADPNDTFSVPSPRCQPGRQKSRSPGVSPDCEVPGRAGADKNRNYNSFSPQPDISPQCRRTSGNGGTGGKRYSPEVVHCFDTQNPDPNMLKPPSPRPQPENWCPEDFEEMAQECMPPQQEEPRMRDECMQAPRAHRGNVKPQKQRQSPECAAPCAPPPGACAPRRIKQDSCKPDMKYMQAPQGNAFDYCSPDQKAAPPPPPPPPQNTPCRPVASSSSYRNQPERSCRPQQQQQQPPPDPQWFGGTSKQVYPCPDSYDEFEEGMNQRRREFEGVCSRPKADTCKKVSQQCMGRPKSQAAYPSGSVFAGQSGKFSNMANVLEGIKQKTEAHRERCEPSGGRRQMQAEGGICQRQSKIQQGFQGGMPAQSCDQKPLNSTYTKEEPFYTPQPRKAPAMVSPCPAPCSLPPKLNSGSRQRGACQRNPSPDNRAQNLQIKKEAYDPCDPCEGMAGYRNPSPGRMQAGQIKKEQYDQCDPCEGMAGYRNPSPGRMQAGQIKKEQYDPCDPCEGMAGFGNANQFPDRRMQGGQMKKEQYDPCDDGMGAFGNANQFPPNGQIKKEAYDPCEEAPPCFRNPNQYPDNRPNVQVKKEQYDPCEEEEEEDMESASGSLDVCEQESSSNDCFVDDTGIRQQKEQQQKQQCPQWGGSGGGAAAPLPLARNMSAKLRAYENIGRKISGRGPCSASMQPNFGSFVSAASTSVYNTNTVSDPGCEEYQDPCQNYFPIPEDECFPPDSGNMEFQGVYGNDDMDYYDPGAQQQQGDFMNMSSDQCARPNVPQPRRRQPSATMKDQC